MTKCARCKIEDTELYENGTPLCLKCLDKREPTGKPATMEEPIRATLLQDLYEATARNNNASQEFDSVLCQFPSGLPHPDGSQRIKNASCILASARKEMMKAHSRLNDYLERGIVPDDLKGSG